MFYKRHISRSRKCFNVPLKTKISFLKSTQFFKERERRGGGGKGGGKKTEDWVIVLPRLDCVVCSEVSLLLFPKLWALSSLTLWLRRDCDILVPSGRTFCFKNSFYSSILAHQLSVLEFVKPLPPDPAVQSCLSPSVLRNLVNREFNGLWSKSPQTAPN